MEQLSHGDTATRVWMLVLVTGSPPRILRSLHAALKSRCDDKAEGYLRSSGNWQSTRVVYFMWGLARFNILEALKGCVLAAAVSTRSKIRSTSLIDFHSRGQEIDIGSTEKRELINSFSFISSVLFSEMMKRTCADSRQLWWSRGVSGTYTLRACMTLHVYLRILLGPFPNFWRSEISDHRSELMSECNYIYFCADAASTLILEAEKVNTAIGCNADSMPSPDPSLR